MTNEELWEITKNKRISTVNVDVFSVIRFDTTYVDYWDMKIYYKGCFDFESDITQLDELFYWYEMMEEQYG